MTSQPGKQTIAIHILPNISRSKGNQIMKFGQLIEYNMRNIFRQKSYTKSGEETIPRSFSKKSNLACVWIDSLKFVCLFLFYVTTCFYHIKSFFNKQKEVWK